MTWYKDYRIAWIAECLRVYGFINRSHLQRKFDISSAQAANDFKEFNRRYPNAMKYDASMKRYIRSGACKRSMME